MTSRIILFTLLLLLIEAQAKKLITRSYAVEEPAPSPISQNSEQPTLTRYATKEIILYLTPSQIRALEAARAQETIPQPIQSQYDQKENLNRHNEFVRQQFENIKAAPIYSHNEEPRNFPLNGKEQLSSENQQKKPTSLDLIHYQNKAEEQLKLHYLNYFAQLAKNDEKKYERKPEVERDGLGTYSSNAERDQENRNNERNALRNYNFVAQQDHQALEKQTAHAQAHAISNSLPILVHEEVKITRHHPVQILKHAKLPLLKSALIPIPENIYKI